MLPAGGDEEKSAVARQRAGAQHLPVTSLGETPCGRATSLRLTQKRRAYLVTSSLRGVRALARDG